MAASIHLADIVSTSNPSVSYPISLLGPGDDHVGCGCPQWTKRGRLVCFVCRAPLAKQTNRCPDHPNISPTFERTCKHVTAFLSFASDYYSQAPTSNGTPPPWHFPTPAIISVGGAPTHIYINGRNFFDWLIRMWRLHSPSSTSMTAKGSNVTLTMNGTPLPVTNFAFESSAQEPKKLNPIRKTSRFGRR